MAPRNFGNSWEILQWEWDKKKNSLVELQIFLGFGKHPPGNGAALFYLLFHGFLECLEESVLILELLAVQFVLFLKAQTIQQEFKTNWV